MTSQDASSFTALWHTEGGKSLEKRQVPTPTPSYGQAIVKVLAVRISALYQGIVDGKSPLPYMPDNTPGSGCIGRIEAVGPDSVNFKAGQLVYVDPTVRARDDDKSIFLQNSIHGFDEKTNKLVNAWKHGTLAEKCVVPLENVFALDESILLGSDKSKYKVEQLINIGKAVIPYVGWKLAKLLPGETVAVAFATGDFGGAAIDVALSMGAGRVLALGRHAEKLADWRKTCDPRLADKVIPVVLTGDVEKDAAAMKNAAPAGIQIFFDMAPPAAAATAHLHINAGINALERGGRMVWMGFVPKAIPLDYSTFILNDLSLYGKYMYSGQEVRELIRLIETGLLSLQQYQETLFTGFDNFDYVIAQGQHAGKPRTGVVWSPQ